MINMEEPPVKNDLKVRLVMFPDMHSKEFQCPICAKYFSRKFTLDAHMLIHKGEKPHSCQFCGKCFRQKGTLMRHKALHSTKNLFYCSLCNQGFRQKNVFIFHLRHRHNVSTETLDRRKYRTEPKDYQSIIDTLPPFVHVDSAAISSSEKNFDAMLCESFQKPVNSSEMMQHNCIVENNLQDVHSSNTSFITESISQDEHKDEQDNFMLQTVISSNEEVQNSSENVKSMFNNFNEVNTAELSSLNSNIAPNKTLNPVLSHVTSSDDFNCEYSENITCTPCQLNFNTEVEFKYHMKTHVQSVLLADVNTDDTQKLPKVSSVQSHGSSLCVSLPESNLFSRENSFSNPVFTPNSLNVCDKIKFPIKDETLESKIEPCFSQITPKISRGFPLSKKNLSYNQYKLKCPICNIFLDGDCAIQKHSKMHDSYSLLKLICESLGNKNVLSSYQNNCPIVTTCSENVSHNYPIKNNKLQNVYNIDVKKSLVQSKHLLKKYKLSSKVYICVQCNKKFQNKFLFEYHHQLHLSTKGFLCRCCKKSFLSKKSLLSHTRLHHMKTFTCPKCSQFFNYRRLFDFHQKLCTKSIDMKSSNGSNINFSVMNIESILNSDLSGIVGIIPVCTDPAEENRPKLGIPVMSVSHIKSLYSEPT